MNARCLSAPTQVLTATALAAGLFCSSAFARAPAQPSQQLERVYVTGSNIKRIDNETAAPIQVISRKEIQQTGANTVRQILDTFTSTTLNELRDDGSSNSFASGASGTSLRGLGKQGSLVLLNGRRIANYALADGAQITFPNVDSLPADVVDRVEILADGASAIYGSDAMAGVINIITRKDYVGLGASVNYQVNKRPSVGNQRTASLVGGFGDLERDRFNVLANVEMYKRDGYMLSEIIPSYPEWHKRIVSTAFGDPSLASYPGNLFKGGTRSIAVAGCTNKNTAGFCVTDVNGLNQVSDPAKRINAFTAARAKLSDTLEGFAELSYSKTETDYRAVPFGMNAPGTPYTWFDGNARQVQIVPKPLIAANNPANSLGQAAGLEYRFMDNLNMWENPAEASQYRVLAGLRGTFGGWDYEAALGRTAADGYKAGKGAHRVDFINAITSGEYKIGGTNSQELLDRMFRRTRLNGENHTNFVDAKVTGELFKLPAGAVQVAFGGELRDEYVKIKSDENLLAAQIIGNGSVWVEGSRKLAAVFGEAEIPIVKGLSANTALRYDRASGFDGRFSPKVGLRWEATRSLLLRGTVASGFRAPGIPEAQGKIGLTGFFGSTLDPRRCDTATQIRDILKTGNTADQNDGQAAYDSGCSVSLPAMISANPKIKPETSRSATLGFVYQPSKQFSASIDYFTIERRDEISYRTPSYVLARELTDPAEYGALIARLPVSSTDMQRADRANTLSPGANISWSAGPLVSLLLQYENFGKTKSSGFDIDLNGNVSNEGFGRLDLGLKATYATEFMTWDVAGNKYRPNTVGNRNVPRVKAVGSAAWSKGAWGAGVRVTYYSATNLNNDETDIATWGAAGCTTRLKPGELPCYRGEDYRVDLNLSYTGIKDLTLALNLGNAMGDQLPVNLRDGYGVRPRTFRLGASYRFW